MHVKKAANIGGSETSVVAMRRLEALHRLIDAGVPTEEHVLSRASLDVSVKSWTRQHDG